MEVIFGGTARRIDTANSKRPAVNRQEIENLISKRSQVLSEWEKEVTAEGFIEASLESLQWLLEQEDSEETLRKFIREGDRVILCDPICNHIDYAIIAGMTPEDAGFISKDSKNPKLVVMDGSESLGIKEGNVNRPTTMQAFNRIAPELPIEEQYG